MRRRTSAFSAGARSASRSPPAVRLTREFSLEGLRAEASEEPQSSRAIPVEVGTGIIGRQFPRQPAEFRILGSQRLSRPDMLGSL